MITKNRRIAGRFLLSFSFIAVSLFALALPLAAQNPVPSLSMWNRGVYNLYSSDGTTSLGPNWMGYATAQGFYNSLSMNWASPQVSWTMTAEWDGDGKLYPIYLRDYSGGFTLFDGLARLTAGKVLSDEYRLKNFDYSGFSTRIANAQTGLLVQVFPVKEFSLGAFLPMPVAAQGLNITLANTNFGLQWAPAEKILVKTSLRLEPSSAGDREASIGLTLSPVENGSVSLGYTFRDVVQTHALLLDASYRLGTVPLKAFADLALSTLGIGWGGKINAEYSLPDSPYTIGASVSYGDDDFWGLIGLDMNPYFRYNLQGGSLQAGLDVSYKTAWAYKLQLAYTVGF